MEAFQNSFRTYVCLIPAAHRQDAELIGSAPWSMAPKEELHAMAERIGVARKWYQGDHYDICLAKRAKAVAVGAIGLTRTRSRAEGDKSKDRSELWQ